jgi:anaerobic magnesium-protoporphyrin IX monomethyl ester cyclase
MDVVLINPKFRFGKNKWEVGGRSNSMQPPLDMGWISNLLEKEKISSAIIDANINRYDDNQILRFLKNYKPKIIITTSASYPAYRDLTMKDSCLDTYRNVVKLVKRELPDSFVVLIGPHGTAFPKKTLESTPELDAVVVGESEFTCTELAKQIVNEKSIDGIKNIFYRTKENKFIETEKEGFRDELDEMGIPPYEKLELEKYVDYQFEKTKYRHTAMVSSRGCSFKCIYCFLAMVGNKQRTRSNESVLEEIDLLYNKYGIRHISFIDETFTLFKKRVETICNELIKRNYELTWDCETRTECLPKNLIKLMSQAGCNRILFGIESLSPKIQKTIRKEQKPLQVEEVLKNCKEYGIYPTPAFQLGLPGDSMDTIKENLRRMDKLGVSITLPLISHIFPKTELHEIAKKKGWIKGDSWEELIEVSALVENDFKDRNEFNKALKYYHKKVKLMNMRKNVNYPLILKTIKNKGLFYTIGKGINYLK